MSLVFALAALAAASALAQPGMVLSQQKISETQGGFTGTRLSGTSVAALGDLDGDEVGELAVGSPFASTVWVLFLDTDGTVQSQHAITDTDFVGFFGYSVASLGDLDGDGVGDLAVGAIWDSDGGSTRGAVWILFLNTNGTVKSSQKISDTQGNFTGGLNDGDNFGYSIVSLGDIDGDSVVDLAVGAWGDDDGGNGTGAVWVLFLNTDGTVKANQKISDEEGGFTGLLAGAVHFGSSVASLGDLDGDGVGDLAVGAPSDDEGGTQRGSLWVLFLDTDGTVKSHQKISETQGGFTGSLVDFDQFGVSMTSLDDLDGDGVRDLAVGASGDDDGGPDRGATWVLFINSDGTVKAHQKISDAGGGFTGGLDDGDFFGTALASIGDLDGDGVGDLAVGANGDDDGGNNRGAVWVLLLDGAREVLPDSFSLFRGMLMGGVLSDLFDSDDSWITVQPGITLSNEERQVQLIVTGTAPSETAGELKFRVEAHADITNIGQWIDLWNYDTNSYEQVDFMIATTVDSIVEVSITTDPGRFIQAGTKQMRARVSYKEAGIVLLFPWLISFDQTVWVIVP